MNKQLFVLLLLGILGISCQKDLSKDHDQNKPNDVSTKDPVIALSHEYKNGLVVVDKKLFLKGNITHHDTIKQVEWTITENERNDNYQYTKVAGIRVNKKSIDFSMSPLLLVDAKADDMMTGVYSAEIVVTGKDGNKSTVKFSFKVVNSADNISSDENNFFRAANESYSIEKIQYSVINRGTSNESVQLQLCSQNTSVSKTYLSKGSVVWFVLNINDSDFKQLKEKRFNLNSGDAIANIYLNKSVTGKDMTHIEATKGNITIKKVENRENTYSISFNLTNDDESNVTGKTTKYLVKI